MGNAVMKGPRIADTHELRFEASKRSDMACSALLGGRFTDSQKSRFQVSKRSYMRCADLEVRCLLIFTNSFQAAKRSDMYCFELQGGLLLIVRNGIYRLRMVQIREVQSFNRNAKC